MPARTLSIISAALTVVVLILFSIIFLFFEMIALNGASERQGLTAMALSLICQGITVILAAMLAWRLTALLVTKFNWNAALAVIISVVAVVFGGGLIFFLSVLIAIPVAGIR